MERQWRDCSSARSTWERDEDWVWDCGLEGLTALCDGWADLKAEAAVADGLCRAEAATAIRAMMTNLQKKENIVSSSGRDRGGYIKATIRPKRS
jgi:hypothetical protein